VVALSVLTAAPAWAELSPISEIVKVLGFSDSDAAEAKAGRIVRGTLPASNERELVSAMMFLVPRAPDAVVEAAVGAILEELDENTISWGFVGESDVAASLSKLRLEPDGAARAERYAEAEPGEDLNLSTEEIARLNALGEGPPVAAVEAVVRETLAARIASYRSKGLAGIAPYARSGGEERSVADDLRAAIETLGGLERNVPSAYRFFLDYPESRPDGTRERLRWSQGLANDVPTLTLTHNLYVPDGNAWLVLQRQFYVSEGYNCQQAVAALLPVAEGTAVFYIGRTSTDQVTGFGGGAKRAIGSKLMGSEIEALFEKLRQQP
jgi:hypothetical protein